MINLKNGLAIQIRPYKEDDFQSIHELNKLEHWTNLVENKEDTKSAWNHSNAAYVATLNDQLIGYIRGITDRSITLFICELLIDPNYRGIGLGKHSYTMYIVNTPQPEWKCLLAVLLILIMKAKASGHFMDIGKPSLSTINKVLISILRGTSRSEVRIGNE